MPGPSDQGRAGGGLPAAADKTQRASPVRAPGAGGAGATRKDLARTAAMPLATPPPRQPVPDDLPPSLGPYRLTALLGEGGMGRVLLGHDDTLDRPVALKVLSATLASDNEFSARFLAEARAVAKVQHENVVAIHYAGREQNVLYFAMQYVEGSTIEAILERDGPLAFDRSLDLVRQAAQGLGAALERGIIHRDIKPSNLIVDRAGKLRVVDFGLAKDIAQGTTKLTATGSIVGTPTYISPEQGRGEPPTFRSDIYSLGVTLYHMLTGRPPFEDETPLAVIHKHIAVEPPPLATLRKDVPSPVARVLSRMMAKNAADRFDSYAELTSAIDKALGEMAPALVQGPPVAAPPPPRRTGMWEEVRDIALHPSEFFRPDVFDRSGRRVCMMGLVSCALGTLTVHARFGLPRPNLMFLSIVGLVTLTAISFALGRLLGGRGSFHRTLIAEAYSLPLLIGANCRLPGPLVVLDLCFLLAYVRTRIAGLARAHEISILRTLVVATPWFLLSLVATIALSAVHLAPPLP